MKRKKIEKKKKEFLFCDLYKIYDSDLAIKEKLFLNFSHWEAIVS